ncbi:phage baseplate assembly protein V [Herbivorax sp. ANBcel31]|uniref:phage baseplate assembly protein V n=1 Tax=Herbivorax sp. ANBcel31 TaxID=3069754 RepID=UPI0027B49138|nr:phage baseplate assembly protein V [Herbivorax sp. ANBcel31]MDQ2085377.1 phage baseplate assembly protein V [Herbivorax sp. ANBcel31]
MSIYDLLLEPVKDEKDVIYGVMIGIVVDNNNEKFPGMVKVELLTREPKKNITDWIRVATLAAGKNRGTYFIPEIGDEVLVAFIEGNINKPYVIGCLWNNIDKVPDKTFNKDNHVKKIKTKGGHEIVFNDEKGKEYIDIHTPGDFQMRMDDEKNNILLKDKDGSNLMEIDTKKGTVTVKGKSKVVVESGSSNMQIDGDSGSVKLKSNNIQIDGSQSIKLKTQSMSIEAGMLNIKASSNLNVKSDGAANIKGAVVKIN